MTINTLLHSGAHRQVNPLSTTTLICVRVFVLHTHPQFITKKCSDGLGEAKFAEALDLLKKMQEGDCRVTLDGVEYDGNEEDDVGGWMDQDSCLCTPHAHHCRHVRTL